MTYPRWLSLLAMIASPAIAQTGHARIPATDDGYQSKPAPGSAPRTSTTTQRITLVVNDSTIGYLLRAIARQANIRVSFDRGNAVFSKRVSVKLTDTPYREAFTEVLKGTGLVATPTADSETIVIRPAPASNQGAQDETGTVTGRVTDSATGKGISGVTVSIQDTRHNTITNANGAFTISGVPAGTRILIIKALGYASHSQSVLVSREKPAILHIQLASRVSVLSGVVTTATGQQRKAEVGNAITSINVDSVMQIAPITSVTDLLETRVPGLTVQRTSGAPGDPARLRLRGTSSINGNNDPIVVVDGIRLYAAQSDTRNANLAPSRRTPHEAYSYAAPSPLDQIDPNTIQTIDVFKGPSAAALYGSDAANGVIVITTKRGRAGPPQWTMSTNYGVAYLPGKYPEGKYRWGTLNLLGIPLLCNITNLGCRQDSIVSYQALNDPHQTILDHGTSSGLTTTVSGGTQTLQYALTGSMATEGDYLRLSDAMMEGYRMSIGQSPPGWMRKPGRYRTWGGQGKIDMQITPAWNVSFTSSIFNSAQQRSSLGLGGLSELMTSYLRPARLTYHSPFYQYYERVTSQSVDNTNSVQANWQAAPWLPISMTVGLQTLNRTDESLIPRGVTKSPTNVMDTAGHFGSGRSTTNTRSASINTTLPAFGERLQTVLGLTYMNETFSDMRASITGLSPGISIPTSGLVASQATGGRTSFGWLVEPKLNVQSRFFVIPGFRLDNNGLSGNDARLMRLPKMNISWLISDESFFPKLDAITLLRLRAGYGAAGVQPGPTDRLRLYSIDTTGATPVIYRGGAQLSALGNTRLRPERGTEWEGGFEAAMWHNRVSVDVTWYRKMRYDAIEAVPLPPSVDGGSSIKANIGVIRNTGSDMTIGAQLIERSAVSWYVGASMWRNANRVERLNAGQLQLERSITGPASGYYFSPAFTRIVAGYPLLGWWAPPIVSYDDVNGNRVIEENEIILGDTLVYLGMQEPGMTMNVSTNLTFLNGRLGVSAAAAYTGEFTQFNVEGGNGGYGPFSNGLNDPNASFAQQAAALARTAYGSVQTVTVWRFQSFSVSYVVDPAIARLFRATNMRVALQGSNLGLKSNYRGKDPNVNSYTTGNTTADIGAQPQPRTWSLRVTLGK